MSVLESKKYDDIISWSLDGKAFIIKNEEEFENIVLPHCFKLSKFSSFLRKLYRWNFSKSRMHSSRMCPAYAHSTFKRGDASGCIVMATISNPTTYSSIKVQEQAGILINANKVVDFPLPGPHPTKLDVAGGNHLVRFCRQQRPVQSNSSKRKMNYLTKGPAHWENCGLRSDKLTALSFSSLTSLNNSVQRSRRRHKQIISACYNNLTMQRARQQLARQKRENAMLSFELMRMKKQQITCRR